MNYLSNPQHFYEIAVDGHIQVKMQPMSKIEAINRAKDFKVENPNSLVEVWRTKSIDEYPVRFSEEQWDDN